jgi:hypothetical protein
MYSETAISILAIPQPRVMGEVGKLRPTLAAEFKEHDGAGLNRCYQCRSCGIWGPMTMRSGSSTN